jgi:outer membrane protein assembly factor BamA
MRARAAFAPLALALVIGWAWGSRLEAGGPIRVPPASATSRSTPQAPSPTPQAGVREVVSEIRIHGNVTVPDADVLRLAAVAVGDALAADSLDAITSRLRASGHFASVEVRKRYRSLDMTDVALVIIVHEREALAQSGNPAPGPMRRVTSRMMFLPILDYEDGYGFTYGARVSTVGLLGAGERISAPLSWGGTRQAAVEVDRSFRPGTGASSSGLGSARPWLTRLYGRFGIRSRENPHYELRDERVEFLARAEHAFARAVRAGVEAGQANVDFGGTESGQWTFGVDAALDTRGDPAYPMNAVYLSAGWTSLNLDGEDRAINRVRGEASGYLRLFGQSVLALRTRYDGADRPLPPYEQNLLGGGASLRGHPAGAFAGDRLAAGSVEVRLPFDSVMGAGRAGVVLFYDAGKTWNVGQRPADFTLQQGAGAGAFLMLPFVRMNLDVARNLTSPDTRVHFGFGFSF